MNSKHNNIFTLESIKNFNFSQNNYSKKDISSLHLGLLKLGLVISSEEIRKRELGNTTKEAIKQFQTIAGLQSSGILSKDTVKKFREVLEHKYYATNKTRIEKLHKILDCTSIEIHAEEKKKKIYGISTENAIKEIQFKLGIKNNGLLSEDFVNRLKDHQIRVRFNSKTQVGKLQRLLLKAGKISKLDIKIDPSELKEKKIGTTTSTFISALQSKYNLETTGNLDSNTYEKISSITASRPLPTKKMTWKNPASLSHIKRPVRLNSNNNYVAELQKTLAFLGYKINEKEFKMKKFGKTTREAVLEYQRSNNLPITGHVNGSTLKQINKNISKVNTISNEDYSFRLKGRVRDDTWKGKPNVKVQVWEKVIHGQGNLLAERLTLSNGFFDIPYNPPLNPKNHQIKKPFHLQIKILDQDNANELGTKLLFNPTLISWVNFTEGNKPYRGVSEYELKMKVVVDVLNGIAIEDLNEKQDVIDTALNSGISQEDVMKLILSHRIAKKIDNPDIKPEVCYSFVRQNLPPNLPNELLASTSRIDTNRKFS